MSDVKVIWPKSFEKQLRKMDKSIKTEIISMIQKISESPELGKPLGNALKNCFEERVKKYRIIYSYYNGKVTLIYIHDKEKGSHDNSLINAVRNCFRNKHFAFSLFITVPRLEIVKFGSYS